MTSSLSNLVEEATQLGEVTEAIFTGFPPLSRSSLDQVGDEAEFEKESVAAVGLRALHSSGTIRFHEIERVVPPASRRIPYYQLQPGDVLTAIRGSLEKSAIVTDEMDGPVYATANVAVIRPMRNVLDSFYLWSWIQGMQAFGLLASRRATTGQLSISTKDLSRLVIALPPYAQQREIGSTARSIWEARRLQQAIAVQYERTFQAFLASQFNFRPFDEH